LSWFQVSSRKVKKRNHGIATLETVVRFPSPRTPIPKGASGDDQLLDISTPRKLKTR